MMIIILFGGSAKNIRSSTLGINKVIKQKYRNTVARTSLLDTVNQIYHLGFPHCSAVFQDGLNK